MKNNLGTKSQFEELIKEAKSLGASDSAVIFTKDTQVKGELAALCNGEYTCPNYGLAKSCPPHVAGPEAFRKWQKESEYSVTIKIELPTSVMFSDDRKRVMQLLHQIVSGIEHKAVLSGFENSKAFAGGSCKDLFCDDEDECCVVHGQMVCRHKELARPSMSGFGIDVIQLMKSSGWSGAKAKDTDITDDDSLTWVAGLVMLA